MKRAIPKLKLGTVAIGIYLALFIGVSYRMFIAAHIQALRAVRTQYSSQKRLQEVREEKKKHLADLQQTAQGLAAELEVVEAKVLWPGELTSFWNDLSELIAASGNQLTVLRPTVAEVMIEEDKDQPPPVLKPESVQLNLEGSFASLREFLIMCQNQEKLLKVDWLQVSRGDSPGQVAVDLVVSVYVREE